jgi:TetR/AcrR family transcriptional regulator, transcriptional repressor for nem operon
VIELRLANTRKMLEQWESEGDNPADRIRCFINILIANRIKIMAHGCPVGTLCAELAKLDNVLQGKAGVLFTLFRDWLSRQFTALGCKTDPDALAMHLLARSQGVATLANTFHDETFIREEVAQMNRWLAERIVEVAHSQPAQQENGRNVHHTA